MNLYYLDINNLKEKIISHLFIVYKNISYPQMEPLQNQLNPVDFLISFSLKMNINTNPHISAMSQDWSLPIMFAE